jgi:hypothetical protein
MGENGAEYRFKLAIALSTVAAVLVAVSTIFAWIGIWNWILAGLAFVGVVLVALEVYLLFKVFNVLKARGVFA